MRKKAIIYLLVACFILPLLTGCSKKGSGNSKEESGGNEDNKGKGRYIELEVKLSEKNDQTSIVSQLLMKDGSIVIYTADYSKSNSMSLARYRYDSSKSDCEKDAPQWLQNIPISSSPYNVQVLQGTDGAQYLFWVDSNGGHLCNTTDEKTSTELNMEGWKASASGGQPAVFSISVGILENGLLVANTTSGCYLYEVQSGKQKEQITGEYLAEALAVTGNKFAIVSKGDDGEETMTAISVYDAENLDGTPEEINFDKPIPLDTAVSLNKAGDLIIANTEGIHVLIKGTGTWQTMVEGSLNTMYIPNIECDSVLQDDKGNYYIIYKDFFNPQDCSVMKYHFDKTVNTVPEQELTIYTLEDSPLLRAAAYAFLKTHTDYKVSIQVAMTDDSALTKEDYIRSLNTELLSGAGCDLILLDGLPYEAYVEKGVLTDLSEVVNPLLKGNEVFSNVVKCYYVGDKTYAIPSRVKLPCIFGKADAVHACDTLDNVAEYAKTHKENSLLGALTYEDVLEDFLPCYMHHIKTADNKINANGIKKFLEDIKALNDNTGFIPEYKEGSWKPFCEDLAIRTTICMNTITELMSTGFNLSFTHYVDGDFIPLENSYLPANIIGINKASKQQEAAKEFVEGMLSDEIQMLDIEWMGLPVKIKALENMKVTKWWDGEYPVEREDGTQVKVPLSDTSASDKEKIISYCKAASELAYTDDNILKALKELGKNYVLRDEPIDKTVELIMNKLSIYNEE